jgi:hypothetical protein
VFWECHTLSASEVLPQGSTLPRSGHAQKRIFKNSPVLSSWQITEQWNNLVLQYSQTSLSFVDDRLLAIAGVAKRFCSAMGLEAFSYLAGMWKGDLPQSLLWYQMNQIEETNPDKSETNIAPSWSWASMLAGIDHAFNFMGLVTVTEVVNTWIDRRSRNIFTN